MDDDSKTNEIEYILFMPGLWLPRQRVTKAGMTTINQEEAAA